MGNYINYDKSAGLQNPLQGAQSPAIISPRAPTVTDFANPGQFWVWVQPAPVSLNTGYLCLGSVQGDAIWSQVDQPINTFNNLTVNPGPTNLTGAVNVLTGPFAVTGNSTLTGVLTVNGSTLINNGAGVTGTSINAGTSAASVIIGNNNTGAAFLTAQTLNLNNNNTLAVNTNLGTGTTTGTITIGNAGIAALNLIAASYTIASGGATNINANPLNLNQNNNAPTNINAGTSTGEISIGNGATSVIDIASPFPTVNRLVTISGGTTTSAVGDLVSIAGNGVNFAGSSKVVSIADGDVINGQSLVGIGNGDIGATGENAVSIGSGTVADLGSNAVGILTGAVAAGGVSGLQIATGTGSKLVLIGNADALTTITANGTINLNANSNGATNINTGAGTGTVAIGNAAAGDITMESVDSIGFLSHLAVGSGITLVEVGGGDIDIATQNNGNISILTVAPVNPALGVITIVSSSNTADAITLQAPAGGISLTPAANGSISLESTNTVMSYINSGLIGGFVANNAGNSGRVVFPLAGTPLAANGVQLLTINNAEITVNSMILMTIQSQVLTDQLVLNGYVCTAGTSFEVNIKNVAGGVTTGNVALNWWILGY